MLGRLLCSIVEEQPGKKKGTLQTRIEAVAPPPSSRHSEAFRQVCVRVCAVYLWGPARSVLTHRWCSACSCGGTSSRGCVSARPGRPGPPGGRSWLLVASTQHVNMEDLNFKCPPTRPLPLVTRQQTTKQPDEGLEHTFWSE